MLEIIEILLAALIGGLATRFWILRRTSHGYFYLEPIDEENSPGEFQIRISISSAENYLNKRQIVLTKGKSQN